jgi:hypothetical protein
MPKRSWRRLGACGNLAETGPSPFASGPWQGVQRFVKSTFSSRLGCRVEGYGWRHVGHVFAVGDDLDASEWHRALRRQAGFGERPDGGLLLRSGRAPGREAGVGHRSIDRPVGDAPRTERFEEGASRDWGTRSTWARVVPARRRPNVRHVRSPRRRADSPEARGRAGIPRQVALGRELRPRLSHLATPLSFPRFGERSRGARSQRE